MCDQKSEWIAKHCWASVFYVTSDFPIVTFFRATTLSNAVSSLASTGLSLTRVDEREKQAALEEEQARLKALKVGILFTKGGLYSHALLLIIVS